MTSLDLMGTHSSPVHSANKYLRFIGGYIFCQFTALPFSIATVLSRVHQGSKRVETDGSRRRHQYSPVYRRLANDNNSRQQCQGYTHWGCILSRTWVGSQISKISFISNYINQSYGYNSTSG